MAKHGDRIINGRIGGRGKNMPSAWAWGVGGGHGRAGGGGVWDREIHGIKKHIGWPDEWSSLMEAS